MLTRRGWLAAVLAVLIVLAGRVVGIYDLYVIGAVLLALVALCAAWVGWARLQLSVVRRVQPARVHVGESSRVELRVTNLGNRRTPVLDLQEPVSGTPGAAADIGPILPESSGRVAYQLPTDQRGVIKIGPLQIRVADPLGFATVKMTGAPAAEATIYPQVMNLMPVPTTFGLDRQIRAETPNSLGRVGDDFFALRDYVLGDDLRRVHWKTTARRGDLMVRHDEQPSQGRLTLLLDSRRHGSGPASFEPAVSLAASIITASTERRDLVRIITTDGGDSGFGAGRRHLEAIMEYLARVGTAPHGSLSSVLGRVRDGHGGAFVYVTPANDPEELAELRRAAVSLFGFVIAVVAHPSTWDPTAPTAEISPTPGSVVFTDPLSFRGDWAAALRRAKVRSSL